MRSLLILLLLPALLLAGGRAAAAELDTAFAVVRYTDEAQLKTFNRKISTSLFGFGSSHGGPLSSATREQVNQLVGRVQEILDMRPAKLHFTIELLDNPDQVQRIYQKQYGRKVDFIAFYSPRTETIYVAINKLRRTVIAHEMAHAVIDRYFDKAPPVKIHELLAQYVEKQL